MTELLTQFQRKLGEWFFDITDHNVEEISVGTTIICAVGMFVFAPGGIALCLI